MPATVLRVGKSLTREQECERILESHRPDDFDGISNALDRQFRTIHNRAQLLLGISGVLISASVVVTTGKLLGRPLFEHQRLAARLLVAAGILDICGASVLVGAVLTVRWITQQPGADLRAWVMSNLVHRDRKTGAFRVAIGFVLLSMMTYQAAISVALLQL